MKKEVLFAILIGFAIGLIITFGIYQAQQSYQSVNSNTTIQSDTLPPSSTPLPSHQLSVTFPLHESVVSDALIVVEGKTSPEAFITIVSDINQTYAQADSLGQFSLEYTLEYGANILTVTSLTSQGDSATQNLIVTYVPESDSGDISTTEKSTE